MQKSLEWIFVRTPLTSEKLVAAHITYNDYLNPYTNLGVPSKGSFWKPGILCTLLEACCTTQPVCDTDAEQDFHDDLTDLALR